MAKLSNDSFAKERTMNMIRFKKATALLLSALLVSSCMAPCAFAASKKKVGKINLTIDTDIRSGSSGGEVEVTATGDNTNYYYLDSVEVTNDEGEDWSKSNPPEAEILIGLEDEDEYTFSGTSSSNFKLTLANSIKSRYDKVEYVSASKKDGGATIALRVRLVFDKDADMSTAPAPGSALWFTYSPGMATWTEVPSAKYYQLQLYKDGSLVTPPDGSSSTVSVYGTYYDFSNWVTDGSSYTFKVRSVKASNNAKSKWVTSFAWTPGSTSGGSNTVTEGWKNAADNVRWWYQNADGSYPASQWKEINGKWYYFDAEGYMATGWIKVGGLDYCLAPDGALYVNCTTPDGYNVNADGVWVQ